MGKKDFKLFRSWARNPYHTHMVNFFLTPSCISTLDLKKILSTLIFWPINQKPKSHGSHIIITLILLSLIIIIIIRGEPGQSSAHRRLDCWSLMSTGNVKCGRSMNRCDKQGMILGLWVQDIPRDKTAPPPQTPIAPELNEFRRQKICWGRRRCGAGYCAGPSGPGCVREVSGCQGALMNAAEPPRLPPPWH